MSALRRPVEGGRAFAGQPGGNDRLRQRTRAGARKLPSPRHRLGCTSRDDFDPREMHDLEDALAAVRFATASTGIPAAGMASQRGSGRAIDWLASCPAMRNGLAPRRADWIAAHTRPRAGGGSANPIDEYASARFAPGADRPQRAARHRRHSCTRRRFKTGAARTGVAREKGLRQGRRRYAGGGGLLGEPDAQAVTRTASTVSARQTTESTRPEIPLGRRGSTRPVPAERRPIRPPPSGAGLRRGPRSTCRPRRWNDASLGMPRSPRHRRHNLPRRTEVGPVTEASRFRHRQAPSSVAAAVARAPSLLAACIPHTRPCHDQSVFVFRLALAWFLVLLFVAALGNGITGLSPHWRPRGRPRPIRLRPLHAFARPPGPA